MLPLVQQEYVRRLKLPYYPPPSAGGGVTSVSGTAPIVSSGGTTPAISITAATVTAAGSMSPQEVNSVNIFEQLNYT